MEFPYTPQGLFGLATFSLLALKIILWALTSIILLELVRVLYHVLHHESKILYSRFHRWHHCAYKGSFQNKDSLACCKSFWYYDLPEAFSMVIAGIALLGVLNLSESPSLDAISGTLIGCCYALREVLFTVFKFCGVQWEIDADVNHSTDESLVAKPGKWKVNLSYHWRHHFHNEGVYLSGIYSFFDQLLGTAVSLRSRRIASLGELGELSQPLQEELMKSGARPSIETKLNASSNFNKVDILILNAMSENEDIEELLECVNRFFKTVTSIRDVALKEIWVLFPETELLPGLETAVEVNQKVFSNSVTIIRLDSPCVIRKVVVRQPSQITEAQEVAQALVSSIQRDSRNIVPGRPAMNLWYKLKETAGSTYCRFRKEFSNRNQHLQRAN
ncbi:sterol desaturase family protein [Romeria aff. gracilis LEGE 07310]|uniref:Sterol desaturase family protein n=1 Tax=Vasconcelosia minhoensis LEGE 07310 TaxID=915328 RepID=A0A8J7AJH6_9CYAN|nr:sterol desaturase family protein [Romeria gracilis]MBE9080216.1 sterol desaturase family protein [Romeria aff. gracilis LEGE 07310]